MSLKKVIFPFLFWKNYDFKNGKYELMSPKAPHWPNCLWVVLYYSGPTQRGADAKRSEQQSHLRWS